jgi:hypothetical protein
MDSPIIEQVEEMLDGSDSGRKLSSDQTETYFRLKIAAEHDASFRAKVQEALDDPRPPFSEEEAEAHMAKLRSEALTGQGR